MVNMKCEDESHEMEMAEVSKYPYGLKICLDDDALEKLGIKELPAMGSSVMILAKAMVVACRSNESMAGGMDMSCELQITDMEVKQGGKKSASQSLYGEE